MKQIISEFGLEAALDTIRGETPADVFLQRWYDALLDAKRKARAAEGKEGVKTELLWRKIIAKLVRHGYACKPRFKNVQGCAKAIDERFDTKK